MSQGPVLLENLNYPVSLIENALFASVKLELIPSPRHGSVNVMELSTAATFKSGGFRPVLDLYQSQPTFAIG